MSEKALRREKFYGREFLLKGLNVTDNAIMVSPAEMVIAKNIQVGSSWNRSKRPGQEYWSPESVRDDSDAILTNPNYPINPANNAGAAGPPILGIKQFFFEDTSVTPAPIKYLLVARQEDRVYYSENARLAEWYECSTVPTLPTTGNISFQPYFGRLYWVSTNPEEGLNYIDPATPETVVQVAAGDTPEAGTYGSPKFLGFYQNRLVAGGVPGFKYTLYFSEVDDPTMWMTEASAKTFPSPAAADATSLLLDQEGDPDGLNGVVTYQNRIYAFMRRIIYQVTGSNATNFVVEPVVKGIGAISQSCIYPIGDNAYFLSERGLHDLRSTDTALESEYGLMSRDIAKIYHEQLDKSREDQWFMEYREKENLLLIHVTSLGSTENDLVLVYNTEKKLWTTWEGLDARCGTKVLEGKESEVLTGRENGEIALLGREDRYDFDDTDYEAEIITGTYFPGMEADEEHIFEDVTFLFASERGASIEIQIRVDGELVTEETVSLQPEGALLGSTFVLGVSTLTQGVFIPKTIETEGRGFGMQIRMKYPSRNNVEFYGFLVSSRPAGHRRT